MVYSDTSSAVDVGKAALASGSKEWTGKLSNGSYVTVKPASTATGTAVYVHNGMRAAGTTSSAKNKIYSGDSTSSSASSSSSGSSSLSGAALFAEKGRSTSSPLDEYFNRLQAVSQANNAWSAEQAQKQMDFQQASADKAMQFNHDEAELNRLWQEQMSSTAHQREVKDLQAAGLNPVLSVMGGSGAPVTSGATASGYASSGAKGDTDTSLAPALVSLLGSVISANASMANTLTSAQAQERIARLGADTDIFRALTSAASAREVADIQGTTSRDVANIQGATSRDVAGIQGVTSQVVAQIGAGATVSSARIHAAGQAAAAQISGQYNLSVAKTNQLTNILTHAMDNAASVNMAAANRDLQKDLQQHGFDFQMEFAEDQYSRDWKLHMWDNGADILKSVIGALGSYGRFFTFMH